MARSWFVLTFNFYIPSICNYFIYPNSDSSSFTTDGSVFTQDIRTVHVRDLNFVLRFEIFVHWDGQLCASHLILGVDLVYSINCMIQKRACWAKLLFWLTIYLYGGSGYPTLDCFRLRDPMRSLSSLSLHFLLLRPSLSLSFLPQNCIPLLFIRFSYL